MKPRNLFRLWLGAMLSGFRTRRSLMLENLALRQQLAVFKRQQPRPRLGAIDKLFWVVARRFWAHWKKTLFIVLPDTVARWHRSGFKLYWAMLCKARRPVGGGRRISKQIRELIFQMVADNPGRGAPRIHGELLMLGFDVCLANCYFSQDSSGFPVLLPFCDAQSDPSFHPFHCRPGSVARSLAASVP